MGHRQKKEQPAWDFNHFKDHPEELPHFQALGEALQNPLVVEALRYFIADKIGDAVEVLKARRVPDLVCQNRLMQASGATQLLEDLEETLMKIAEAYPEFVEYLKNTGSGNQS